MIRLDEKGKDIGEFLFNRHKTIEVFLKNLGVQETRLKETEMVEHDVSIRTLACIDLLNEFQSPNPDVMKRFEDLRAQFYQSDTPEKGIIE